ncbi:MAG: sugar phosphate isomerase/epimerase [Flavobacteriales bacterium]|nr:sugar phosphate isomerase/epimerase [Flavobacteriales bacterium]
MRFEKINESVEHLVDLGFKNIELSGGTIPYENLEDDLINLKVKHNLNYLVHNYFPPPIENFVLNLASLDDKTHQMSLNHCLKAINLSAKLGGDKIAFHAGFLLDIPLNQIGKRIQKFQLFNKEKAIERFNQSIQQIAQIAQEENVKLYIENNVLSAENWETYSPQNPFFFTDLDSLEDINMPSNFQILLDIAHLKVSCKSLELNFSQELPSLFQKTDYIHVSDNNGFSDQNCGVQEDLYEQLSSLDWKGKTVTLEVYGSLKDLQHSYELLKKLT